ncbi:D-glycero-D-manno-heptose 1,7-bisphosphate phosphatase [Anseongella ginsenosidimutans]|uniref:D,D-heptose 1,7-bisphosphate phosphatase n=1 Tax=Anseongella ginsenosidimutans TaxID=496056 RepID=A0A4R3KR56_9SPHI|nr:HAD family hydrolase [Anseongella ginsenosidimutans]QEC53693.1 HAD family hydrolase [Anseongella ginsenosidimutans]TCS86058.1 D-glycero-D-manno-heptose 1,7-bisphosphate phosphatase [Anseongella ginsenosidimutans]
MNKAVFLDRDGVLNRELGDYVCRLEDFEVLPDVAKALRILRDRGFLLIVVTNQGGIAKGWYSHEVLHRMHEKLREELSREGVTLSEIYYSPQHPLHTGNSLCRKPGSLMLEKALARFDIDPSRSYLIGDRERDVEAAEKVGIHGILIESDQSLLSIMDEIN